MPACYLVATSCPAQCSHVSQSEVVSVSVSFTYLNVIGEESETTWPLWCLQGQTVGHRPSHQGRYTTNSGGVRSGGSSPFQSPGLPPQQGTAAQPHYGFQQQMGKPQGQPAGCQATLSETDLVDLAMARDFPQAQQPFIMFLQAADSHRLNTCLVRYDLI